MAEDLWRRPSTPSELAGSAVARLAGDYRYEAFVRHDRVDGTVETVGIRKGRLTHYLVYADGTLEIVASLGRTVRFRLGSSIVIGGLLVVVGTIVVASVLQPENSDLWVLGPVMAGFLVAFLGALVVKDHDLWAYLRSRTGSDVGWVESPYKLGGWPARSSAQLAAVKELSDHGEGDALVRNLADGAAEVATSRDGYRYTHFVDPTGAVSEATVAPPTAAQRWGIRLMKAGVVVFWLSWLAFAISVPTALFGLGLAVLMWLTGWFLERNRRTQEPGDDGSGRGTRSSRPSPATEQRASRAAGPHNDRGLWLFLLGVPN